MPTVHFWDSPSDKFRATWSGLRTSETRSNLAGIVEPGAIVILRERSPDDQSYTGRRLAIEITHVESWDPDWRTYSFRKAQLTEQEIDKFLAPYTNKLTEDDCLIAVRAEMAYLNKSLQELNLTIVSPEFKAMSLVDQGDILSQREVTASLCTILIRRVNRLESKQ